MSYRNAPAAEELDQQVEDEAFSLIDRHTTVDGTLSTERDLRVDGRVLGTLQCGGVLFVADGAEVDATVDAAGIVVSGTLSGTIVCRGRLEIRSNGVVRGAVETGALVILEGAVYEGELKMTLPPPSAQPELAPPPAATEPAGEQTTEQPNAYSFLRRFSSTPAESASADEDLPAADSDREGH